MEEHRDEQDYEERGQRNAERSADSTAKFAQTVADEHAHVHSQSTGARLRHSYKVEKLLACHPLVLVYHLSLYLRNHGVATAEREESYLEEHAEC